MNPVGPGAGLLIVKLACSLGLVVGLILVLQKAARRWGRALGAGGGAEVIRLLSQRSVGPRLSLAVVEVRGRTLLVGISPQGIQAVADLDAGSSGRAAPRAGDPSGPPPIPAVSFDRAFAAAGGAPDPQPPSGGATMTDPRLAGPAPARGLLERLGFRARGAASFAAAPGRPAVPGGSALRRGAAPAVFEDELLARLASLRDRYPSLADVETDATEAWR